MIDPDEYYDSLPPREKALWDKVYDPEPWPDREEKVSFVPWPELDELGDIQDSDLEMARANNGNPTFRPYLDRAIKRMKCTTL